MNRRELLCSLLTLPSARMLKTGGMDQAPPNLIGRAGTGLPAEVTAQTSPLRQSAPLVSMFDGQIFEYLDIFAHSGPALTISHANVTIRHCRIRHVQGPGLVARGALDLSLHDCDLTFLGAPERGRARSPGSINVALDGSPGARIWRVRAAHASSNIYAANSPHLAISKVELHDARGPAPRGQNIQFDKCPASILEDFSAENGPTSWTEDNISIFRSNDCIVRRGIVSYNNSPTGDGVMIEGSFNCTVEDVNSVQQGNGAFAAVPQGTSRSGNCSFIRCRTRDSYNTVRDGREKPSSDSLAFYVVASQGAPLHRIIDCRYTSLANSQNLIWKRDSLAPGWTLTRADFVARAPIRLKFDW